MIPVFIKCKETKYRQHKRQLKKFRLRWNGTGFSGNIPARKLNRLKEYCRKNHLSFSIDNEFGKRSSTYRRVFFQNNPPLSFFSHPFYFCSYCGLPVAENHVTVDHLYPVGKAKTSVKFQEKMRKRGFSDINDVKNLIPACQKCNLKKGQKTGLWILKGKIGKHQRLWFLRNAFRLLFLLFLVWLIVCHGKETSAFLQSVMRELAGILAEYART